MPISTNFNVNPYYDDYDEDKQFLRLLYKPGYAVQARELTQAQTLLQKQVERFGNHIFKNGSIVTGGQVFLQNVSYMNLDSQYATTDILAADFVDKIILTTDNSKRGQVIKVYDATANTPHTLLVKQIYGNTFTSGDSIKTLETGGDAFANRANISTLGTGTGQVFSVNDGVFYYEGFFVKVDPQAIGTSIYNNNTANVRIGFEVTESIVESVNDTSLLDPAQGASNFQAPGSDRFKIELNLTTRSLDSVDLTKFIELAQVKEGILQKVIRNALYANLEDTLARRTYDESGDYVVNPFLLSIETNASNTANMDLVLSAGKAYVKGYEYQTISPITITVPKPRDTINVNTKFISADFGSYVYTFNHFALLPSDTLGTIDIHCVQNNSIWTANTAVYSNTKIGTARVKSVVFDTTAGSQSDASTYVYKTYLTDINVGSIVASVATGVNTSCFALGSATVGSMSNIDNAYAGAKIRIVSGPGAGETPKTITTYSGSTKNITTNIPFAVAPTTSSIYSIDFEIKDAESFVEIGADSTKFTSAANIYGFSKDQASTYENVFVSEKSQEPLLFKLGEDYVVANSIANFSYEYQKFLSGVTISASTVDLSSYLSAGETLTTTSTSSISSKQKDLIVQAKTTSGIYVPNQIIAAANLSVSGTTLTISSAYTGTADMFITVRSDATSKNKNYVRANVVVQNYGAANNIFGNSSVFVINDQGQTQIHNTSHINKLPGLSQSLYVSDVVSINAIFDFQGTTISQVNMGSAANVTSRYLLDTGQRDSYYDHASIILKAGVTPPTGPLLIRYNRYTTSNTPGYYTVDSYLRGHNSGYSEVAYENVPRFTSISSEKENYLLRDHLDFRPWRQDASANDLTLANTKTFGTTTNGLKIPLNGSDIVTSFKNYLPRIDKVVLNVAREFSIIKGESSVTPSRPQDKEDSMTLYILSYPPFVDDTKFISVRPIKNQRYTMKDIGNFEKRIENLEYYTSLSLLEFDTATKQDFSILDSANLPRFKNGFIVDAFNGTSVSNVLDFDFKASIDRQQKLLRPTFNVTSTLLNYAPSDGDNTNINRNGPIFTVDSNEITYLDQPLASRSVNINPFNVINYLGKVQLDPSSDVWYDETRLADLAVDISGDRAAWQQLVEGAAQTEWDSWKDIWTSTQTRDIERSGWQVTGTSQSGRAVTVAEQQRVDTLSVSTTQQGRTGVKSTVTLDTLTKSLGDRVVDVSIIPYMRDVNILIVGDDFYPSTQLFSFFDAQDVSGYVARANKIVFRNNNLKYQTQIGNPEVITFKNNVTGTTNAQGIIVKTSNNVGFFVSAEATSSLNVTPTSATLSVIGQSSTQNNVIEYFEHYTGNAAAGGASTITLNLLASGALNATNANFTGEPIKIISGKGVGQSATISAYDPATRIATITPAWTTVPDVTSRYTVGRLTTTDTGSVAGIFFLPTGTFRVGEKLFRLIDDSAGNLEASKTNGDARFFAAGLLQTKQESSITATVPAGIQRSDVSDTRTVQSTSFGQRTEKRSYVYYVDPLAQTFFVNGALFPNGLYISKIRVCFRTKDPTVPVTLQIRPTVNGFPHSSVVYPFGTVTLTPDKVTVSEKPGLDDAAKFTDFVFDAPIYLLPGEHSFVLLANSNQYEVYCAEKGKTNLLDNKQISDQPYGGSLFLSQNGSTWTPEQNLDMMFRVSRNEYSQTPSQVVFHANMSNTTSNVVYDLIHLMTGEMILPGTSVTYKFASERAAPYGGAVGYKPIIPLENYIVNDGERRRVLNPTTGNTTFKVIATLATSDSAISPYVDTNRFNLLTVENRMNNLPLSNDQIVIANTGSGMTSGIYSIALSNTAGGGAILLANVVGGSISRAWVQDGGSAYVDSPSINLFASLATSAGGYTGGMCVGSGANGASIIINGETSKSGGPATARYIMRTVTLEDGFDSGDIRVYLTAYKPAGSDIYVYFKPQSVSDIEKFSDLNWQLLTQINNGNFVSTQANDFRELVFAPGINGVANNSILYSSGTTSFTNYKSFAIKIVMSGSDTVDVPLIRDLRVIALPEGNV